MEQTCYEPRWVALIEGRPYCTSLEDCIFKNKDLFIEEVVFDEQGRGEKAKLYHCRYFDIYQKMKEYVAKKKV